VAWDGTGTIGTNQTILAQGNVATVYKNAQGDFTITFTTAMPDANYAVNGGCAQTTANAVFFSANTAQTVTPSTFQAIFYSYVGAATSGSRMYCTFFR
jgi:hypothetical protein